MTNEREALHASLCAGRWHEAARRARALARAGAWDLGVAATIVLHASEDAPERELAEAWLDVALLTGRVGDRPDDAKLIVDLLERLVAVGLFEDARMGLRVGTRAGRLGTEAWLSVVTALYAARAVEDAWLVAEEALACLGEDARLWSAVAHLRLVTGQIETAAAACAHAEILAPSAPDVFLTRALLHAVRGDQRAARAAFAAAGSGGAPPSLVARLSHLAGLDA